MLRKPYLRDERVLTPLTESHQLRLLKRILHYEQFMLRYSFMINASFYIDPALPNHIIVERNVVYMVIKKETWNAIEQIYLHDNTSIDRLAMSKYYEKTNIDAPSIGLFHSQYQQKHPLYDSNFAMITAWNPNNKNHGLSFNQNANHQLKESLEKCGFCPVECIGYLEDHSEDGFIIPDISFEEALAFGREFEQYSIFYNTPDIWGYYESSVGYPVFMTTRTAQVMEYRSKKVYSL